MNARYLLALFAVVLLLAGHLRAAQAALPPPEDSFLAGYVSAILVREFKIADPVIDVAGGYVTVKVAALPDIERDRIRNALSELNGVLSVRIETAESLAEQPEAPVMAQTREPETPATKQGTEVLEAPESARGLRTLPAGRLFNPLWADPRWAHFSAAYHYYRGDEELNDAGAVSFGESFGLLGGSAGKDASWQIDFQAAVFGLFDLNAESKDLVNADYWVGIPVSYRNGNFSAIARLFHQSSHLGDEFLLRRQDVERVNLSYESVDLKTSYEFDNGFRLYGGAGYLFRREPADLDPWSTQIGAEYAFPMTYRLPLFGSAVRPVAAADLQNRGENDWRADLSLRGGIQFESPVAESQQVQMLLEYFNGSSPNGQFYDRTIDYIGLGLHVYLQ